jgi:hypothetical protein
MHADTVLGISPSTSRAILCMNGSPEGSSIKMTVTGRNFSAENSTGFTL